MPSVAQSLKNNGFVHFVYFIVFEDGRAYLLTVIPLGPEVQENSFLSLN